MAAGAKPISIKDQNLGLSFQFEIGSHLEPRKAAEMLVKEVPVIRRFLDDPVNSDSIGSKPDPRRNAFLALLLAADRLNPDGGCMAALPLQTECKPEGHAGGGNCPLCSVMGVLAGAAREGFIKLTKVDGTRNEKGRYTYVIRVELSPAARLAEYRERIKRLSLPPLLTATSHEKHTSDDCERTVRSLSAMRAESWDKLALAVHADSFAVNGITVYPSDLGLAQHEWAMLCDLAKGGGRLAPSLLGPAALSVRENLKRLSAALKAAFPQIPGEPIESTGTSGYQAVFTIQSGGGLPQEGISWGGR